jgi:hypothetical protein
VTLDELRIESWGPFAEETRELCARLVGAVGAAAPR